MTIFLMTIRKMFGVKWPLAAGMVLILTLLSGCQEEPLPDEEGAEVSLHAIPKHEKLTFS